MEGGGLENATNNRPPSAEDSLITDQLSVVSLNGDENSPVSAEKPEKDPRKIARKYQMDLCKKALEENVVVYLGTGCGKTHIAVLLIYEMGQLIRKPQKSICVFLAPTVALVQQQAKVIEDSIDFKVGTYCSKSKHLKSHQDWEREMEQYEVLVMTPQILLRSLSHCYIRIEFIALLIFDECHYAQVESDHPYAEIMKIFYKPDVVKLPRIFGMTASPISGKGATVEGLETLLRSKVYSVEDKDELEQFVASPKVNVYYYGPGSSSLTKAYSQKLEEIKHQCVKELHKKAVDTTLRNTKKMLKRLHGHLNFSLENLGVLGALQASCILLRGDHYERHQMVEAEVSASDDSLCDKYLSQVDTVFSSGCAKDFDKKEERLSRGPIFATQRGTTLIVSMLLKASVLTHTKVHGSFTMEYAKKMPKQKGKGLLAKPVKPCPKCMVAFGFFAGHRYQLAAGQHPMHPAAGKSP
ncbi:hypothetical protein HAX54_018151 [Datura stramonium]|uniref:Helicase ATP-binding domain-containing protein n=1 Tax=Datura stramonium TaxID=4076 RepID=A0ABS8ULZ7_DATST|nr:hypothetical protein [Datura stramonium]